MANNQITGDRWNVTINGGSEPCIGLCVSSASLLSIFTKFKNENDTEKCYCFYKVHQSGGYEQCNKPGDSCWDSRDSRNIVQLHCANNADDFSGVVDDLVDEMWSIMSQEDKNLSMNSVEIMKHDIKNRLGLIKLVKNNCGHTTKRNVIDDSPISYIVIDIGRTLSDDSVREFKANDIIKHNIMRPLYISDLLFALTKNHTVQDENNVEVMLKAVLIHELRHVWQHIQAEKDNSRHEEIRMWFTVVNGRDGNIDIMSEVDAYDFQRDFEESKFPEDVRCSNYTKRFKKSEDGAEGMVKTKVEFLWASYKNKKVENAYVFRNHYGLNR
jgi:hypothetical protein